MNPAPIDHKDEPGKYRRQVRAAVMHRVGRCGRAVTKGVWLVGDWDVAIVGLAGEPVEPVSVYRLRPDGTAAVETAGQPPVAGE